MKLDNFLIVRRTFYLSKITVVESLLTVIVNTACTVRLSDWWCYLCEYC